MDYEKEYKETRDQNDCLKSRIAEVETWNEQARTEIGLMRSKLAAYETKTAGLNRQLDASNNKAADLEKQQSDIKFELERR
eukprot:gene17256-753_t